MTQYCLKFRAWYFLKYFNEKNKHILINVTNPADVEKNILRNPLEKPRSQRSSRDDLVEDFFGNLREYYQISEFEFDWDQIIFLLPYKKIYKNARNPKVQYIMDK